MRASECQLTDLAPLVIHPNHRGRRLRMILLRLLVLVPGILLARRLAVALLGAGGAVPLRRLRGRGLDVQFVGAVRDVLVGLAALPVGCGAAGVNSGRETGEEGAGVAEGVQASEGGEGHG